MSVSSNVQGIMGYVRGFDLSDTVGPGTRLLIRLSDVHDRSLNKKDKNMSVKELSDIMIKDRNIMKISRGGVTFTGDNVFDQELFLQALLSEAKKLKIHTSLLIGSRIPRGISESIIEKTDLAVFNIDNYVSHNFPRSHNPHALLMHRFSKLNIPIWVNYLTDLTQVETKEELYPFAQQLSSFKNVIQNFSVSPTVEDDYQASKIDEVKTFFEKTLGKG